MTSQTITELQTQLAAYQRRLAVLQTQLAQHGSSYAPPAVITDIDEARAAIVQLTAELRARGVSVDETPGVETPPSAPTPTGGAQIGQAEIAGIVSMPGASFAGAQGIQITGVQVGQRTPPPKHPPDETS